MDIARPNVAKEKRRKRIIYGVIAALVLVAITVALSRLKPASPTVEKNLVWMDVVKRGPMVRQVRGLGTLVPEEIRWLAARTSGRVEKIILRSGAPVQAGSLILELANPDIVQGAANAVSQLNAAEAKLATVKVQLESGLLAAEATAARAKSDFETTKLQAEVKEQLFRDGLVSDLELKLTQASAAQAAIANSIEQKRYAFTKESMKPQLAEQEAEVERLRSLAKLRQEELDALQVRAPTAGVLSAMPVEVGAQVQPGTNLARVADPTKLKAEIRVAETQARDIAIGQIGVVDTRNGVVEGRVSRIDAAVQNGTVLVDVTIVNELPRGSRPDLSVDGTIELERLDDVIYVGRPAFGQEKTMVGIFKANGDKNTATEATRVQVKLGRSSVNTVEIVSGLAPGDWVILSDMSPWDANEHIRLN